MNTNIALFRGINVGGNNILPMKNLVDIFEGLGCNNVRTYIQSGNVVFQLEDEAHSKIAKQVILKVLEHFNFEPTVLLLGLDDLLMALKNNPFKPITGKDLHFYFLDSEPLNPDIKGLCSIKSDTEEFKLVNKVFYLFAPDGIGRSKLAAKVEQKLKVPTTARNWNTVSKLIEMASMGN